MKHLAHPPDDSATIAPTHYDEVMSVKRSDHRPMSTIAGSLRKGTTAGWASRERMSQPDTPTDVSGEHERERRRRCRHLYYAPMAISVEELAARLNTEAARRGMATEDLLDALASQLPPSPLRSPRFAFAGQGHSGRGDLAERHKQIRDELTAGQRASGE